MSDVAAKVTELKDAITEFDGQYVKYSEQGVNTAGSRARKALMIAKKAVNALRKFILTEQKAKKAERKAAKAAAPKVVKAPKAAKVGKKGKAVDEAIAAPAASE